MRVELTRGCPRGILSPLRLPFRHPGECTAPQVSRTRSPAGASVLANLCPVQASRSNPCAVTHRVSARSDSRVFRRRRTRFWLPLPTSPGTAWLRPAASRVAVSRRSSPVAPCCPKSVRVWRNWQTQHTRNVRGESPWEFESPHPHPGIDLAGSRAHTENTLRVCCMAQTAMLERSPGVRRPLYAFGDRDFHLM